MKRNATAEWKGNGKTGTGNLLTQSSVLNHANYSFNTRFEDGVGTNPEELIAAAHAGCFTMKLSFVLDEAGFVPVDLKTKCEINFENGQIVGSHLILKANIPGISIEKFNECVNEAAINCPISRLLNTAITHEAELVS